MLQMLFSDVAENPDDDVSSKVNSSRIGEFSRMYRRRISEAETSQLNLPTLGRMMGTGDVTEESCNSDQLCTKEETRSEPPWYLTSVSIGDTTACDVKMWGGGDFLQA